MDLIERFLTGCIVSARRQRILFELSKPKKYVDAISRFAHNPKWIIEPDSIVATIDSEHIPQDYFKGELLMLTFLKMENLGKDSEQAKRIVSSGYGPIVLISSSGTALVKTEDNEILLLRFEA